MELQMRQDNMKRVGGYDGPANWERGRPLTEEEKQAELIYLKRGSYITRLGNKMQEQYEIPFANMSFKDLQAIFIAKVTKQGNNSASTDENEARGVHVRMQGEGAGVEKTMSMAERGEMSAGVQRTGKIESKITVLYHGNKIYYSRTDAPMLEKMVELQMFNTEKSAMNNIPRLRKYAEEVGKFKLKPGSIGKPRKDFVPYRGACGSGMPSDLKVWMSVGEIPKDGNVTELKLQPKRKRAASTKRTASTKKAASNNYSSEDEQSEEISSEDECSEEDDN
jgi:hypothetical protein